MALVDVQVDGATEDDIGLIQDVVSEATTSLLTRERRIADAADAISREQARILGSPLHIYAHLDPAIIARIIEASDLS